MTAQVRRPAAYGVTVRLAEIAPFPSAYDCTHWVKGAWPSTPGALRGIAMSDASKDEPSAERRERSLVEFAARLRG